jgi:hypothetical protein
MMGDETLGLVPEAHSIRRQAERLRDLYRASSASLTTSNNLRQQAAKPRSPLGYGPRAPWVDFSAPLQKRDTFQRSSRTVASRSVGCRSIGIRREQRSEKLSTWGPHSKVGLARPRFALNRLAKSLMASWARGELAMSTNGDGEKPRSKDDLFDLNNALPLELSRARSRKH